MSNSRTRQRPEAATSRYTPEEWAVVAAKAAAYGQSVGQYQRAAALQIAELAAPRVRRRPTPELEELRRLLGQVGKIGSNVNQIAAVLNAGEAPTPNALESALASVVELRAIVREVMRGSED